ncbi:MAG: RnfH family protein [Mariprofundaceae bacterium]|nr:RnfH family protein [Mariprofundaceae bacterium]
MHVTIAYALPHEQLLEELNVPDDTTVEQAIHMSHLLEKYEEIDLATNKVGIFSKLVKLDQSLREGDRIEIYRSLPAKPRDAHAADDKKARIRAKKERTADDTNE